MSKKWKFWVCLDDEENQKWTEEENLTKMGLKLSGSYVYQMIEWSYKYSNNIHISYNSYNFWPHFEDLQHFSQSLIAKAFFQILTLKYETIQY